jgi:hypothetical protein
MSEPGPETEVISCPACNHLLRVPLDWLGTPVQCPECQARFKAPACDGSGGLTAAELISRPTSAAIGQRRKPDMMLLLPALGLLVCGVAGVIINGLLSYKFLTDPVGSKDYLHAQIANLRQYGVGADDPEADRDRLDAERAENTAGILRSALPAFAVVSAVVLLGGLSIALRWNYRLGQVGCVAASLNIPHLCCIPGAIAGVWGLLMLASAEGREHFGR